MDNYSGRQNIRKLTQPIHSQQVQDCSCVVYYTTSREIFLWHIAYSNRHVFPCRMSVLYNHVDTERVHCEEPQISGADDYIQSHD